MGDRGAVAISKAISGQPAARSQRAGENRQTCVGAIPALYDVAGALVLPADDRVLDLTAGATYRTTITLYQQVCSNDTISICGSMRISLVWKGGRGVTVSADEYEVSAEAINLELDFAVGVSATAPNGSGSLALRCRQGSTSQFRTMLDIRISGQYYAPCPEFVEQVHVDIAEVGDPQVAVVHASVIGTNLAITAYHSAIEQLRAQIPQPARSLAEISNEELSKKIYQAVIEYSRSSVGELLRWLIRVFERTTNDLSVVIVEHADSRVPWEMLMLSDSGPHLGERALVTRWTSVQFFAGAVRLNPTANRVRKGRVLSVLDQVNLTNTEEEATELKRCALEPCGSFTELRQKLETLSKDVALVFLGCHGAFARDGEHQVTLERLPGMKERRITTLDLEGLPQPVERPDLVINACHSARLTRTNHGISGFPELFLATFARSFMGTIGPVDTEAAGAVGAELVKAARVQGGVQIADFLRQLRRTAVREFKQDKLAWKFVSRFMYVYYGSAWDRIELEPSGEK